MFDSGKLRGHEPLVSHGIRAFAQASHLPPRSKASENLGGGGGSASRTIMGSDVTFGLKDWFKVKTKSGPNVANIALVLYTKVAFLVHVGVASAMMMNKVVSAPISCLADDKDYAEHACMNMGMYYYQEYHELIPTVPIPTTYKLTGILQIALGCFYLIPGYIWKHSEGGAMLQNWRIMSEVRMESLNDEKKLEFMVHTGVKNMMLRFGRRSWYFWKLVLAEAMALLLVLVEFYILSWSVDTDFLSYGLPLIGLEAKLVSLPGFEETIKNKPGGRKFDILEPAGRITTEWSKFHELPNVFPVVVRCPYTKGQATGRSTPFDGLCQLSINTLSEFAHVILWVWLILISVIMMSSFVYHLVILLPCSRVRAQILYWRTSKLCNWHSIRVIADHASSGDILMVQRLNGALPDFVYVRYIRALVKRIADRQKSKDMNELKYV